MSDEIKWLVATAILGGISFSIYLIGVIKSKNTFDLNIIVPLLLSCAASVAAVKMMILAFTLPQEIQGKPVASLFDAGSILVGGFVFFITALYGVITTVIKPFRSIIKNEEDMESESEIEEPGEINGS